MFDSLRRLFGGKSASPDDASARPAPASAQRPTPPPDPDPDPESVEVPEMDVIALRKAMAAGDALLVLDVREAYEWAQVHLPSAGEGALPVRHIPMNSLPDHLEELPSDRAIVVMCAHGNRSYGVTHWLNEQGFNATNLIGGITRWAQTGGPTERGS